jgi:hypothetical protein
LLRWLLAACCATNTSKVKKTTAALLELTLQNQSAANDEQHHRAAAPSRDRWAWRTQQNQAARSDLTRSTNQLAHRKQLNSAKRHTARDLSDDARPDRRMFSDGNTTRTAIADTSTLPARSAALLGQACSDRNEPNQKRNTAFAHCAPRLQTQHAAPEEHDHLALCKRPGGHTIAQATIEQACSLCSTH